MSIKYRVQSTILDRLTAGRSIDKLVQVARLDKLEELGKGRTGKALQDAELQDGRSPTER